MRKFIIASLLVVSAGTPSLASATESSAPTTIEAPTAAANEEASNEETAPIAAAVEETSITPPPPIDPLAHIQGRPDAAQLSIDELWTEFEVAFANFERDLAATDEAAPDTQSGFRNYVQAIDSATQVRDLLGVLVRHPEVDEQDRLDALDSYLTIEQVTGSLMVEIQQCERGAAALRTLSNKAEVQERPLLLQGTAQWLAKADRCVERQKLQEQIAARESQADDLELARLRQQLAAAESEDARITEDTAGDSDQLVLSRAELLQLLRESAEERRGSYEDFYRHPRADLPSHEYGLVLRGGITQLPNFVPAIVFEKVGHAGAEGNFGGSFFVRKQDRRRDISLNYDYTTIDMGSEWWVRRNRSRGSARWTELHTTKHTITVGLDRNFLIGKKEAFQFHIGGLFGFSVMPDMKDERVRVDAGDCLIGVSADNSGHLDRFEPGGACYESYDETKRDNIGIPKFLPSLGVRAGMRYVIADRLQLGVEAGLQDVYFFANGSIGVIVGRRFKNR